ncbi:expressed unknown protein [Seminavis robusta]|uniref:Ceramidase n=1 Tax=Seminavis robusta TaxID=568900 RepID=A0A9N8EF36_9STRA|nr:expressed unknown protein [Seminavis robusta]|eukprot:Sro1094_g240600.1 n/a (253) ;mRNA; f:26176-26934
MAEVSWSDQFQRGTTNIKWCEDVVARHAHSDWIAEYYNFWSNLAFCFAGLIGMKRCVELKLTGAFWAAEVVMCFGIGFGSMIFHAHQSKVSQNFDEILMSMLLMAHLHTLKDATLWLTPSKGKRAPLYYWYHIWVAAYWAIYAYTNVYEHFNIGFTIQAICVFLLLFDVGMRFNHSQQKWYASVGSLVIAKVIWGFERKHYEEGTCDSPGALAYHPLWHVGAALSHYFAMQQCAELLEIHRSGKSGSGKKID